MHVCNKDSIFLKFSKNYTEHKHIFKIISAHLFYAIDLKNRQLDIILDTASAKQALELIEEQEAGSITLELNSISNPYPYKETKDKTVVQFEEYLNGKWKDWFQPLENTLKCYTIQEELDIISKHTNLSHETILKICDVNINTNHFS